MCLIFVYVTLLYSSQCFIKIPSGLFSSHRPLHGQLFHIMENPYIDRNSQNKCGFFGNSSRSNPHGIVLLVYQRMWVLWKYLHVYLSWNYALLIPENVGALEKPQLLLLATLCSLYTRECECSSKTLSSNP